MDDKHKLCDSYKASLSLSIDHSNMKMRNLNKLTKHRIGPELREKVLDLAPSGHEDEHRSILSLLVNVQQYGLQDSEGRLDEHNEEEEEKRDWRPETWNDCLRFR